MPTISDPDKTEAFNNFFHIVFTVENHILPEFPRRAAVIMKMPLFAPEEEREQFLKRLRTLVLVVQIAAHLNF